MIFECNEYDIDLAAICLVERKHEAYAGNAYACVCISFIGIERTVQLYGDNMEKFLNIWNEHIATENARA